MVYSAQCEEKVLRAYVTCGDYSQADFTKAATKRLCTDAGDAAMFEASQDDRALRD